MMCPVRRMLSVAPYLMVDPNKTELGDDDVLPFQLSKLFSPLCAANLTAGRWKVIPARGL